MVDTVVIDVMLLQVVVLLGNNSKDASDGQGTCSGVADASGIVATSAAGAGDPTAILLVVWDSEDRRERGELGNGQTTPLKRLGSSLCGSSFLYPPPPFSVSVVFRYSLRRSQAIPCLPVVAVPSNMSSNPPPAIPDTSYARPVAADALSDAVLAVDASPIVQAVTDSAQVSQPPVSLSPPKAKSAKPASNPNYQTRWEREKAKAIQDGVDIEHPSGHRGAGDPQTIGPWIMGEMLGKGASGMWSPHHPSLACGVLDLCWFLCS